MAYTDLLFAQLLQIIANSKLFSELSEQTVISDDGFFASINTGDEDAKKIKLPLLRGYSGDWNATTNTPSLANGAGVSGTVYRVGVAGTRDLGSGAITYGLDEIVYYNGVKWVKLIQSQISDIQGLQVALDTPKPADDTTLDDTNLIVAKETNVQSFAEAADQALSIARSTGVSTTYTSSVSVGGTTFNQGAVSGEISSDEGYFRIVYAGATNITVTNLNAISTFVFIDKTGTLGQQSTEPTREDRTRKIFVMRIGINTASNQIIGFEYENNPIGHYANTIRDIYEFLLAQGVPFKKDQLVTGRATDLGFDVSAGSLLEFGGTGNIYNPNIKNFNSVDNTSYNLLSRTTIVSSETNLVKFWDNNGTITELGSTTLVGHRLFRFSNGNFAIQYGQGNYSNMSLAKTGARLEEYVLNPALKDATFFGWWFVESTATNTGGTTLTDFVEYTLGVSGGSSNSLSGCLLKGNNLSDLLDVSAARTNLGVTALDNQNVKLTGNQEISGTKTFTNNIEITKSTPTIDFFDTNENLLASIKFDGGANVFDFSDDIYVRGDVFSLGLGSFTSTVQAGGYKSSDGSAGVTTTITVNGDTELVFKNGLLVATNPV
tara:strand:- start:2677 stop:4488 length:1812 start_codon:yes stop_codon:yes gene_type:complete